MRFPLYPLIRRSYSTQSYSSTLHLPKSAFPARPPLKQPSPYLAAVTSELYAWNLARPESETSRTFVLHDGPPYANGALHIGHALNKIVKDVVNRFWLGQGRKVQYVPGWDCHGLPIEIKALQSRSGSNMGAVEIRKAARALAQTTVKQQMEGFKGWAIMGDWDNSYRTMDKGFELRQLEIFKTMVAKGLIYRQHKPVYWSPSSRTALAESELEYVDNHQSTAAFVAYPIVTPPPGSQDLRLFDNVFGVIWTTTPWTLPANRAIAINDQLNYCIIEITNTSGKPQKLLIEESRLENFQSVTGIEHFTTLATAISGAKLVGATYRNPLSAESPQPIVHADFVTSTSGTGLVHMAPGHGIEDYEVCKRLGLPAFAPVDDEGKFTDAALSSDPSVLSGKSVQGDGIAAVLDLLRQKSKKDGIDILLGTQEIRHRYPIDWRTKLPIIIRATEQWFADVESIKADAIKALDAVDFIPKTGRARLESFTNSRSQWCISRQRAWGVPIPALYRTDDGSQAAVMTPQSIEHIMGVVQERGIDAWWTDEENDPRWIPAGLEGTYVRGRDTMDVWFDSGTTWTLLNKQPAGAPVADVYLEGSDQHRGWFQSSLLTYIATQEKRNSGDVSTASTSAPFKTLITHGFTLDQDGRKMSKSLGNVIAPEQIMNGTLLPPLQRKGKKKGPKENGNVSYDAMGADALRLWAASSDYTTDVVIGKQVLENVQKALHKYRITFKWILGGLSDFDPVQSNVPWNGDARLSDRIALQQLSNAAAHIHKAYSQYEFFKGLKTLDSYINIDLSASYFESLKDRLYAGLPTDRRKAQTVLYLILNELLAMLSPITPLMVEEVWQHMPTQLKQDTHPIRRTWKPYRTPWADDQSETCRLEWQAKEARSVHESINRAAEDARRDGKMGTSLDCDVEFYLSKPLQNGKNTIVRSGMEEELASMFVVSDVRVHEDIPRNTTITSNEDGEWMYVADLSPQWGDLEGRMAGQVAVKAPRRHKCPRCWRHVAETEVTLCGRCVEAVGTVKT